MQNTFISLNSSHVPHALVSLTRLYPIIVTSHELHGISNHRLVPRSVQQLIQANNKEKLCIISRWSGESTGDQWIPHKAPIMWNAFPCPDVIMMKWVTASSSPLQIPVYLPEAPSANFYSSRRAGRYRSAANFLAATVGARLKHMTKWSEIKHMYNWESLMILLTVVWIYDEIMHAI